MTIQDIANLIFCIVFGFFSFLFFSRLLGVKRNSRYVMLTVITYLVIFDHYIIGKILYRILESNIKSMFQQHFIYFIQVSLTQFCFTIIVIVFFKGDIFKKLAICIIYFIIWQLAAYSISPVCITIFDMATNFSMAQMPAIVTFLIVAFRYTVTCILLQVISKRCKDLSYSFPRKIAMMLLVPSLFILFISELIVLVCNEMHVFNVVHILEKNQGGALFYQKMDVVVVFITAFVGLCSDLIIVFGINNEIKQILNKQHLQMQLEHYRDLEANNQKLQRIRHDMKNHMITILGLLREEDITAAKEYMRDMAEESGIFTESIQSGNKAVDALINTKLLIAANNKTKLFCDIKLPKLQDISDFDLCVIIGNSIDNALEECQRIVEGKERFIYIESSVVKSYFVLQVKNSSAEKKMHKDTLLSKKENSELHGIGFENIKTTIAKNNGTMDVSVEDNVFMLSLMLPLKNRS